MAESSTQSALTSKKTGRAKPLGQRLIDASMITKDQLELGLREQKRLGIYLGDALESLGFVSQEIIASMLAEETEAKIVDVKNAIIGQDVLDLIPYGRAKKHKLIPLNREGNILTVAVADTLNVVAVDAAEQASGLTVDVVTSTEQDIMEAIEHHYAQSGTIEETMDAILSRGEEDIDEDVGQEAPMIRLMDQIIALAVKLKATDIHIEPDDKLVRIRMRVDGVLIQQVLMPKPLQPPLTARLKVMADLNLTEKRIPQDGRVTFQIGLRKVDLRVSTLPTVYGENLVIRVLDKESLELKLPKLGVSKENEKIFVKHLTNPHGIILVTGPTGSGKTSTLYSALSLVNSSERSVFTLEDPIEYKLPMIRQTQTKPDVGMTFGAGLRALLRQDPDVIMVGEIRDTETAEQAVRAALTGHLVFSTLHTNDAPSAIPRLIDMEVEPYLLASALTLVVGQRLVRKICSSCKTEDPKSAQILSSIAGAHDISVDVTEKTLWKGNGCDECGNSGFRGRIGIFELLEVGDELHDTILKSASSLEIIKVARSSGFKGMIEDGISKAFNGITTVSEVLRVTK